MPPENEPALPAPGAPNPPAPPAVPPPALTPSLAPPQGAPVNMTSAQLTERLREAEHAATNKLLSAHGYKSEAELKAAIERLKQTEQATLTEQEKLKKQLEELTPLAERGKSDGALLASLIDEQFKALPEAVQTAIDAEAKGDAAKRLSLMRVLRAASGAQAPAAPQPTPAPAVPPPANVNPSPAPAPSSGQTKYQEWQAMQARSSALGDIFYQGNQREIERTRPASA